jgi:hypothetical protein
VIKEKPQIRELRTLKIGQEFQVYRLEDYYRNLIVLSINDSCIGVKGEYLDIDKKWKTLGNSYTFSCRTETIV